MWTVGKGNTEEGQMEIIHRPKSCWLKDFLWHWVMVSQFLQLYTGSVTSYPSLTLVSRFPKVGLSVCCAVSLVIDFGVGEVSSTFRAVLVLHDGYIKAWLNLVKGLFIVVQLWTALKLGIECCLAALSIASELVSFPNCSSFSTRHFCLRLAIVHTTRRQHLQLPKWKRNMP